MSGVWAADTVFVTSDISLPPNEHLEILPGVYVEFQGYYGFMVRGDGLEAVGTAQAPIVFSVSDTTGFHDIYSPGGGWRGITITGSSQKDIPGPWIDFQHCRIEYAKAIYGESNMNGGGVRIEGTGHFGFYRTTFFNNHSYLHGGGAFFKNAEPSFHECLFQDNYAGHPPTELQTFGSGGGLSCIHGGGYITNNTFLNNTATGVGGGLCVDSSDVVINNNIFKYNYSIIGGGIGYLRSTPEKLIANNLIAENVGMYFGGGIAFIDFAGKMTNNTIAGNVSAMGGGMYLNDGGSPIVENTIFWGNTAGVPEQSQVFIWDVESVPDFYFCNMQYGLDGIGGASFEGEYVACIEEYPVFLGEGDHPYQLLANSPAIDAGDPNTDTSMLPETDVAGNPRVVNSRIDIGAYEYQGDVGNGFTVTLVILNHHGETVDHATVSLNGSSNAEGQYVFENILPGTYLFNIDAFCYALYEDELEVASENVMVEAVLSNNPGDANGDRVVNVSDLISIINYFMHENPQPFCFENADAKNDGVINVLDVIATVAAFAN